MTVASALTVRVWVTDVWDVVALSATPEWTVARLKVDALAIATGRDVDASRYQVKFRGALVLDEATTLGALGVPDLAPFIVLPARRRPAR